MFNSLCHTDKGNLASTHHNVTFSCSSLASGFTDIDLISAGLVTLTDYIFDYVCCRTKQLSIDVLCFIILVL